MKRIVFTVVLLTTLIQALPAIPGLRLTYGGVMRAYAEYPVCALDPNGNYLRHYRIYPHNNGFKVHSYSMSLNLAVSIPQDIHTYVHPVPLEQDGGYPELVLAQAFQDKAYILQKNAGKLFMTVITPGVETVTLVIPYPGFSFLDDPIDAGTFRFLSPERLILSSSSNIYLLNLQAGTCDHYWNFSGSYGNVTFNRLDDERVIISAYLGSGGQTSYLLNYQTLQRTHIYYEGWATVPISDDFGDNLYLVTQSRFDSDWLDLVRTLLLQVNPNNTVDFYPLYYGGMTNAFDYTPKHTFENVHLLGDNRFLAICTDLFNIPDNRRLGIFEVTGTSVDYSPEFEALHELANPGRLYKLQEGYYLSYHHYTATPEMIRLLDLEAQTISLADTNLVTSTGNLITTGDNAFYMVYPNLNVYVYHLTEPVSASDVTQTPRPEMTVTASPNPFRSQVSVKVETPRAARSEVAVYDLRGRLVRRLETRDQDGETIAEWDGTAEGGTRLGSGIYLIRATAGGQTAMSRVVLLN